MKQQFLIWQSWIRDRKMRVAGISLIALIILIMAASIMQRTPSLDSAQKLAQLPQIRPDYADLCIPPNISPLNFIIKENGRRFFVKVSGKLGAVIQVVSNKPEIQFPIKPWHELLLKNQGGEIYFDVAVRNPQGQWLCYQRITNNIVNEEIDNYITYRKIHPSHNTWSQMGIYQRELSSFREIPILENQNFSKGCCHCHSICRSQTGFASLDIRSEKYGNSLLLFKNNEVENVSGTVGYCSWHPRGHMLASSFNKPRLLVHGAKNDTLDIVDLSGWIGSYFIESNAVKRIPGLSDEKYVFTFPVWSPDGRYLYCCGAPNPWNDPNHVVGKVYNKIEYGLFRLSYDVNQDQWGPVETVFAPGQSKLSITQPSISPDGRWLTFTMCEYGCWPIYLRDSDLYIVDLQEAKKNGKFEYHKMSINSDDSESWHSWSGNSRWMIFSSKREHPSFSRPYISYLDKKGVFTKPFRLPQEDPSFYDSYLKTYTMPTFSPFPFPIPEKQIATALTNHSAKVMPIPRSKEITGSAAQYPQSQ